MNSNIEEMITELSLKIKAIEDDIANAKKEEPPDRAYLMNLGQQVAELRREKNNLFDASRSTVGGISIILFRTNYSQY